VNLEKDTFTTVFTVRVESLNAPHVTVRVFANGASTGLLTMRQHELYAFAIKLDAKVSA
jgi:hypothetical protein